MGLGNNNEERDIAVPDKGSNVPLGDVTLDSILEVLSLATLQRCLYMRSLLKV